MLLTVYVVNCLKPVIWKQTSKSKLYIFKVTFSTRFLLIPRFKFIKYHREREGRKEGNGVWLRSKSYTQD